MGLNRLLKKLLPGETLEEALYKKLTENTLNENLYKTDELGEGMGVVYQVINGWWKPRYILNHNTRTAFEFMSHSQYLLTVETEDIEWSSLKKLPEGAEKDNKIKGAMFLKRILESNSIITMSMSAGKSCPYNFAQGFVNLANGHIIKGIKCFCTKIKVPKLPKDKEEN